MALDCKSNYFESELELHLEEKKCDLNVRFVDTYVGSFDAVIKLIANQKIDN